MQDDIVCGDRRLPWIVPVLHIGCMSDGRSATCDIHNLRCCLDAHEWLSVSARPKQAAPRFAGPLLFCAISMTIVFVKIDTKMAHIARTDHQRTDSALLQCGFARIV